MLAQIGLCNLPEPGRRAFLPNDGISTLGTNVIRALGKKMFVVGIKAPPRSINQRHSLDYLRSVTMDAESPMLALRLAAGPALSKARETFGRKVISCPLPRKTPYL